MADDDSGDKGGSGLSLPSVAAAATALIAGVGALTVTGALGRVQRNIGTWFAIALTLVVVGAGLWLAGTLIGPKLKLKLGRRRLGVAQLAKVLGVLVSLAGVVAGFGTAIDAANDTEQPSVTIKVDPRNLVLTGTVTVENLSSQEHLTVYVQGLERGQKGYEPRAYVSQAFVGPNGDGEASQQLNIQLPPGRFDAVLVRAFTSDNPQECGVHAKGGAGDRKDFSGCVLVELPDRSARPQLAASWSGKPPGSPLKLKVTIPAGASAYIGLRPWSLNVVGLRGNQTARLYRLTIPAHGPGATEREVELPIDADVRMVCAQVSLEEIGKPPADVACPVRTVSQDFAAVELRVPR